MQTATEPATAAPEWSMLTSQQQEVLVEFRQTSNTLSPEMRERLRLGADRWNNLDPDQRARAKERMLRWQALPLAERERRTQRWNKFRALPPAERMRVKRAMRAYMRMPPAQRQQLREQFESIPKNVLVSTMLRSFTPAERRRFQHMLRAAPEAQR